MSPLTIIEGKRDWRPCGHRIHRAATGLGLTRPVDVCVRKMNMDKQLGHYLGWDTGAHKITIATGLDAESATWVTWHELGHALQLERVAREAPAHKSAAWPQAQFFRLWRRELRAVGIFDKHLNSGDFNTADYESTPMESECNRLAEKFHGYTLVTAYGIGAAGRLAA